MGNTRATNIVTAHDGLRARRGGRYAEDKLSFIDRFVPPALGATRKKWQRYYVDLFAGPGINVTDDGYEFDGAALRALSLQGPVERDTFTHAVVVNKDNKDFDALQIRLDRRIGRREIRLPLANITARCADSNHAVKDLLLSIPRHAYAFVFLDPENPGQLPWTTIETIARRAPGSTDLYMLFPDDMGLNRLCAYERRFWIRYGPALTRCFGNEDWLPILQRRQTRSQAPTFRRDLADLYKSRLEEHWPYVRCARQVTRNGNQRLYKMFACTRNAIGAKLIDAEINGRGRSAQLGLNLESA